MKKTIKRTAAVLTAAVMMFSLLAGCRNNNNNDFELPEFMFVPEFITLPEEVRSIGNLSYFDGKIFFTSEIVEDWEFYTYTTKIFSMNIDGSNLTELPGYTIASPHPDAMGGINIGALRIDYAGYLWVVESGHFYRFDVPDDYEGEEQWQFYEDLGSFSAIRKLDHNGAEILSVDTSSLAANNDFFHVSTFNVDDDGNIYLASWTGEGNIIFVLDNAGHLQFKLELQNWVEQLLRMPDGSIANFGWAEDGYALTKIDFTQRSWGEVVELPPTAWRVYPGDTDYSILYADGRNLFGVETETGESVKLLNWIDSDVMNDGLDNITLLPDGRVLCTTQRWRQGSGEVSFELIILTKVPFSELPERTILTLSAMWLDWNMQNAIVQFNRTSPSHRIQVFDYAEFNTEGDWNAGLTRLSAEIISGRVPDILAVSNLPYRQYVARGLLEDLYPFIDSDPEFGRGSFMESVLRAAEMDGGLYQIFPSFYINTLVGHPSVVGHSMGWNMSEFRAALDANPQADMPMGQWLTKESFLQTAISLGMDEYVDWATGRVHFDSGGFAQLLEFANTFPSQSIWDTPGGWDDNYIDPWDLILTGRQIMSHMTVYDFRDLQMQRALFGGDIVFKGFPTENRNGNSLSIGSGLAITTRCSDKEGAWEFIRTFLDKDWQLENTWGFTINKAAFDERVEEAMSERDEENWMSWGRGDSQVEIKPLTQENLNQLMELIESVSGVASWDENIMNIVMEGASDFFNGRSSSQDVARVVQSRVSIYISEQS